MNRITPGAIINGWVVLDTDYGVQRKVKVKCTCSSVKIVTRERLLKGKVRCTRCSQYKPLKKGTRVGHWVTQGRSYRCEYSGHWVELCRCDCGTERYVQRKSLKFKGSSCCGAHCPARLNALKKKAKPSQISNVRKYCEYMGTDFGFEPKPCKPTKYKPGTKEKLSVIKERLENGEALFHDDDPFIVWQFSQGEIDGFT